MNKIKTPFLNNHYDNALFIIMNLLNYIHGEFYDFYQRTNFKKSVNIIIKENYFLFLIMKYFIIWIIQKMKMREFLINHKYKN